MLIHIDQSLKYDKSAHIQAYEYNCQLNQSQEFQQLQLRTQTKKSADLTYSKC